MALMAHHPVVNPPYVCGSHLAQVADNNLDARKSVKDTVDAEAEDVALDVLTELQGGDSEPTTVVPNFLLHVRNLLPVEVSYGSKSGHLIILGDWGNDEAEHVLVGEGGCIPRCPVPACKLSRTDRGSIKGLESVFAYLNSRPERIIRWLIVHEHCLAVRTGRLVVIDNGAFKTQLLDGSPKLFRSLLGIMHRERGEPGKAMRVLGYFFGHVIVGSACEALRVM